MRLVVRLLTWILLLLLLLIATMMLWYWESDRPVDELKTRWAQSPSVFIEAADMQIHLRDEGPRNDPTPLVLIHGTSASLHTWDGWAAALKDERRVIRFDLPGFGLTGPDPKNQYSIENYARIVVTVMDHLKVDQFYLAGNSLGGNVAWNTAWLYPNRVKGLVLIDSSGYPFQAQSVPIGFKIARIPVLNRLMEKVLPRSVVQSSVKNVYGDPSLVTPELVDRYFELTTRAGNRQALAQRLQQIRPGQNIDRLSKIKQPTLIIWGGKDRLIPPAVGDQFHQQIKHSHWLLFEDLGHVPQEEDPLRTVAAVVGFLQTIESKQVE